MDRKFAGTYESNLFSEKEIEYEINRLEQSFNIEKEILKKNMNLLDFTGCKTALDVGCGTGAAVRLLAGINGQGTIVGVDRENKYLDYARKKIQDLNIENVSFLNCDCYNMPFEDNHFDICFSRLLFQHLVNPEAAIRELIRVTKPKGKIAICEIDKGLNCFYPEPRHLRKYYDAEVRYRRFVKGDIYFGRKIYTLFAKNGIKDIKVVNSSLDVCNCKRKDLIDMVENWKQENSDNHPLVRTKLIKLEELNEYYADLTNILADEDSYISFGNYFVVGTVEK